MSIYNPEIDPVPLSNEKIAMIKSNFVQNKLCITADGWFNRYGVFNVYKSVLDFPMKMDKSGLPYGHGGLYWNEKLLNLSPRYWRLSINNEGLIDVVSKRTGKLRFQILPEDIRRVDNFGSGWGWVGKSQYLVRHPRYKSFPEDEQRWQAEREQRIDMQLLVADQGERPDHFENSPFVKILDPQYIGRRVMNLKFEEAMPNENIENIRDDGVVIDPRTKQLIARKYEYPLSYERWGVPFPFSPHYGGGH